MLVARIEVWPGGDADLRRPVAQLNIANLDPRLPDVSDYEVIRRPDGERTIVRGHVRDHGWEILVRNALSGLLGDFYTPAQSRVPPLILGMLETHPYLSNACRVERAITECLNPNLPKALADLGLRDRTGYAEDLHRACRLEEKFTGTRCSCPYHPQHLAVAS